MYKNAHLIFIHAVDTSQEDTIGFKTGPQIGKSRFAKDWDLWIKKDAKSAPQRN